jgi:hypothetical protein
VLLFKSPLEVLQKQSPDVSHLKVFDCIYFVYIQAPNRDKLDTRAAKCIFLRYSSTKKGYNVITLIPGNYSYQEMFNLKKLLHIMIR